MARVSSGRDAFDNVLLAQQLARIDRRVRGHNMIIKLDIQKAFDRVSWVFFVGGFKQVWFSLYFCGFDTEQFAGSLVLSTYQWFPSWVL